MIRSNSDDSQTYIRRIRNIPFLDQHEEFMLAKKWKDNQDKKAIDRLVKSHLALVVKIAQGYKGYGLPLSDLIAEGNIGILQATKHFDPDRRFKFSTYATWWIRALIQEYILHSWSLVKMGTTNAQKKLFFSLRKIKAQLDNEDQNNVFLSNEKADTIAKKLNVRREDVFTMYQRMNGKDSSLNTPLCNNDDNDSEWIEWVNDTQDSQEVVVLEKNESVLKTKIFYEAIDKLSPRYQYIITQRRLVDVPKTLEELAIELNLSRERIRQIEGLAFDALKKQIDSILRDRHIKF